VTRLPIGWRESTLAAVAALSSGGTPRAKNPEFYGGDIPWAVIGDLNGGVVHSTAKSITPAALDSSSAKIVPAGTILLGMYGSIGKLGIAGVAMATNQAIATIRAGEQVDHRYLFYYLLDQQRDLSRQGKGAAQRNISQTVLKPWPIRFPDDLGEQRRIVERLDDHLSRLDAVDAYVDTAAAKLARLRDRLVISAITGAELSERTPAALANVGTTDADLPSLPIGWAWARLGDIADVVGGVTKDTKKQRDASYVEVPYLRVANVQRGHLDLDEVSTLRVDPGKVENLRLRPGDVLLNEGGDRDKLARGWVWEDQIEGCIHQNHVFRARIHEPWLDPYFLSWTTNTIGRRWAERNGKQSVNLASISLSMIKKMPVIIPAEGEAVRRVAALAEQLVTLERLASSLTSARARGAALRRALLNAAFSGQVTRSSADVLVTEHLVTA
jgi:type I restriction enzyme, S subunit